MRFQAKIRRFQPSGKCDFISHKVIHQTNLTKSQCTMIYSQIFLKTHKTSYNCCESLYFGFFFF